MGEGSEWSEHGERRERTEPGVKGWASGHPVLTSLSPIPNPLPTPPHNCRSRVDDECCTIVGGHKVRSTVVGV